MYTLTKFNNLHCKTSSFNTVVQLEQLGWKLLEQYFDYVTLNARIALQP
jgi:hypothetical protein